MNRILNIVERHTLHRPGKRHGTSMAIMRKSKQFRWEHKHLLGLRDLTAEEITYILDTAQGFEQISTRSVKKAPPLRGKVVVNLFFEDSTRTRNSFTLAANRLSADVIEFTKKTSSVSKGETLLDTARNLEAMGIDIVVIRHSAAGAPMFLSKTSTPASSMPATATANTRPRPCSMSTPSARPREPSQDSRSPSSATSPIRASPAATCGL